MAHGGVYDQLAGGFHRYSVDERWVVPHFEKMCYDNSELLKNYVHAYQVTGTEFFAEVARDIIRWMDEWLSDREHGGFYASQDADYSMDDDGDYFTWTVAETQGGPDTGRSPGCPAALRHQRSRRDAPQSRQECVVRACLDRRNRQAAEHSQPKLCRSCWLRPKRKCMPRGCERPTPYVDKTVYVGWNGLCISAYLEAAKVLGLDDARRFALRSLDRTLSEAWRPEQGLLHVIAYSDPKAGRRDVRGLLDDYAFLAVACLDAYEASADLSYFKFARRITDAMIDRFYDPISGGFFDTEKSEDGEKQLGVLATRRKPFQDSPTPAGNSMAAIALLRMHGYTGEQGYRDKAEDTLEVFAGVAEQFGIFGATYAAAGVHFLQPHTQVVVIGEGDDAQRLYAAAVSSFAFNKAIIKLTPNEAVAANLPPALGTTIPALPAIRGECRHRGGVFR